MILYKLDYNTTINLDMIVYIDHEDRRIFLADEFVYTLTEREFDDFMDKLSKYYP